MKSVLFLFTVILYVACQTQSTQSNSSEAMAKKTEAQLTLLDSGTVIAMEDIGYPMFALDLLSSSSKKTTSYLLNIEGIEMLHDEAYKLQDHQVVITYTRNKEPFVMDITHSDTSILGVYKPTNQYDFLHITGTVSGATEPSQGDLPGHFTITTTKGNPLTFEYYVDDVLALINGQIATVYYEYRTVYEVLKIEPKE
ncbi:MAG: hypothetical protein ACI9JN_000816 [Bacteroidia bacterium]|jgi:hypothetical protein